MRISGSRRALPALLGAMFLALCAAAPAAQGAPGDPLFYFAPEPPKAKPGAPPLPLLPPPTGKLNGPCGLAVDSSGRIYVSDYHHHAVDVFTAGSSNVFPPSYVTQLANVDPLGGPCGLALDGVNNLYLNNYHRNVEKYGPSPTFAPGPVFAGAPLDAEHPTGVALDPATGNVYVNHRTYIAVYDASGAPVLDGGEPLRIGEGSLQDGYGLAVSTFPATAGRLYVADAATDVVKVYDPALDIEDPFATIQGPGEGFVSLRDSAVAVDRVSGELYVVDDTQPTHTERPQASVHAFTSTGAYAGHLKHNVIGARPVGLAVDNSAGATQGRVYVTSGNTDLAGIYAYPPGAALTSPPPLPPLELSEAGGGAGSLAAQALSGPPAPRPAGGGGAASASEIAQKGSLRLAVSGRLSPRRLPRDGTAPVAVSLGGEITTTDQSLPPQLKALRIELNRHGRLDHTGLPTCPYDRIQPGSSSRALAACRSALVGKGAFSANITLAGQEPYPTRGRLLLFNGLRGGKPVLFGHIYSPRPFATSFVIVFAIERLGGGTYGTALNAPLPKAMEAWGRLSGLQMTLTRRYTHRGEQRSYLSAGCPAPKGFRGAVFPLARASFAFAGGRELSSVLSGTCKARE